MTNKNNRDLTKYTVIDYKKRVCLAMNFISRNLDRELSLEEIASSASFSMFHFHRVFKAVVGETVAGFTRRLRLELAANKLLTKPFDDITTIAMNCGFSSSQNFSKAFRKHFGISPSKYRNAETGDSHNQKENALSIQTEYNSATMKYQSKERIRSMHIEVREIPEFTVAYVRRVGPYVQETCGPAFITLMQWAGPRNYVGPCKVLSIYWDNPDVTPPDKRRFDACIIVPAGTNPEGLINIQTIHGGPYGVCHFELQPKNIQQAWEDAFAWICASGYECNDTPCFELYHNNAAEHPEGKWILDICVPLKPLLI